MPKSIDDLIELAKVYFEDGAPATSADKWREAAAAMQEIAEERQAYLLGVCHDT